MEMSFQLHTPRNKSPVSIKKETLGDHRANLDVFGKEKKSPDHARNQIMIA
jgi:hypothetical protein